MFYDKLLRMMEKKGSMTLGRTLWAIILVKLFIMFFILKLFFFPNFLKQKAPEGGEADYVGGQMVERAQQPETLQLPDGE